MASPLDPTSSSPQFASIDDALEALESGKEVEQEWLEELVMDSKGNYECGIAFEGGDGDNLKKSYDNCPKNPGHKKFIPVPEFKMEHLPRMYRNEETFNAVQYWSNLVVKILVRYISRDRPEMYPESDKPYPYSRMRGSKRVRRFGTGNIYVLADKEDAVQEEVCPCHICETLDVQDRQKTFWTFVVETSKHVIFDASEAKHSIFECFYDSDATKEETVKILYGYGMNKKESKIEEDLCMVTCVTHDFELMERLKQLVGDHQFCVVPQYKTNFGVMVSHPHGCSKRITVGRVLALVVPVGWDFPAGMAIQLDDTTACRLPLFPWSRMPETNHLSNDSSQVYPSGSQKPEASPDTEVKPNSDPLDEDPDDFDPKPGTQFLLPLGTTFTLPPDAAFALRFSRLNSSYFTFPPGTKFTLRNGRNVFFPPEAEFFSYMFSARVSYTTYTVDSCEGSSGAALLQDGGGGVICCTFPHIGKDDVFKDANRSGLQSYTILPKSAMEGQEADQLASLGRPILPQYVRFQNLGLQ